MSKVFPIQTQTSCLLKWAWSSVYFNSGTTSSCHRTEKFPIDPNNFDQFHNLPIKQTMRTRMLNGEWPEDGCNYCAIVERAGGISDRISTDLRLENQNLVPLELHINSTATNVTPTILEVYFKNTCNMKCVYCGPHFSSLWEDENRRFGDFFVDKEKVFSVRNSQSNENYDQMVQNFWSYLDQDNRYKKLQRYHILGGEPFLLTELDDSIEFWNKHPNPDLVFSVITNLNIPTPRFEQYIKQFERLVLGNKIWKLQLTASIDGWGPAMEYVRFGLDLDTWRNNFNLLVNRPWISLSINSAISSLTVKLLPELLKMINHWNTLQTKSAGRWTAEPILHSFNTSGQFDCMYYFDGSMFKDDFNEILRLMPETSEIQRSQKNIMAGIAQKSMNSTANPELIHQLQLYLDELDRRRDTNWRVHFSWLDQQF